MLPEFLAHDSFLCLQSHQQSILKSFSDSIKIQCNCILLACVLSHFSWVWLFVTLWTIAQPGSSFYGILWVGILEWVAMSSFRGWPKGGNRIWRGSHIAGGFFSTEPSGKPSFIVPTPILYMFYPVKQHIQKFQGQTIHDFRGPLFSLSHLPCQWVTTAFERALDLR